jgi:CBS domain-containing protein
MRVEEIMTEDVETVSSDVNLMVAAERMRARDIGFLPVVDDDEVVGVLTDRDIILRGLGEGRDPQLTPVGAIMTRAVLWCYEEDVLTDAAKLMEEYQVRRLLVLDGRKRFVGIVSLDDLAAKMSSDRLLGSVLRNVSCVGLHD